MTNYLFYTSLADPADRFFFFFFGSEFWRRRPKLPQFLSFFMDLSHFILKLLNFVIHFYFMLNF